MHIEWLWIGTAVGLGSFLGGLTVVMRRLGGAGSDVETANRRVSSGYIIGPWSAYWPLTEPHWPPAD